ncbi:MAG: hypothetical protein IPM39_19565 [Chloroflexi bacterium]|nr:hypothetical protein [Chloroflexota bacterium]
MRGELIGDGGENGRCPQPQKRDDNCGRVVPELAIYRGTETTFASRLEKIWAAYARRAALTGRFDKANLS